MASPDEPMNVPPQQEVRVLAPSQYDLTQKVTTSPLYSLYDVFPEDGAQAGNFEAAATHIKEFLIPAKKLLNLKRSMLTFRMTFDLGANASINAKFYPYLGLVSQIRVFTRTGTHLVNITNCQDYNILSALPSHSPDEVEATGMALGTNDTNAAAATSYNNNVTNVVVTPFGIAEQTPAYALSKGHPSFPATDCNQVNLTQGNLLGRQVPVGLLTSDTTGGAGNDRYNRFDYVLKLGDYIGTLLALDKSIMFSDTLVLQITFAPYNSYVFSSTDAALNAVVLGSKAALPAVSYEDMRLRLCQDLNLNARRSWLGRVESETGFVATIPYVTMFERNIGTGTTAASTIRVNRGHGSTLLRIISGTRVARTDAITDGQGPFSFCNNANALISNYQTLFNNQPLQPKLLDATGPEAWYYNQEWFKNGLLSTFKCWRIVSSAHVDQFGSDADALVMARVSDFHRSGYPLETEVTYTRNDSTKTAAAERHLFCVITQKTLRINALGVSVI